MRSGRQRPLRISGAVACVLYAAVMTAVILTLNAGVAEAELLWLTASFALGWITRNPRLALLPLLAVPIAVPFGYADADLHDDPLFLWAEVLLGVPLHVAAVLAGVGARGMHERRRVSRTP